MLGYGHTWAAALHTLQTGPLVWCNVSLNCHSQMRLASACGHLSSPDTLHTTECMQRYPLHNHHSRLPSGATAIRLVRAAAKRQSQLATRLWR